MRLCYLIVLFACLIVTNAACAKLTAATFPRYELPVGRELTYEGKSQFEFEGGSIVGTSLITLTVLAHNVDGSAKLLVENSELQVQQRPGDKAATDNLPPSSIDYRLIDVQLDGRIVHDNGTSARRPVEALPLLPENEVRAAGGWSDETDPAVVTNYTQAIGANETWCFRSSLSGTFNQIYGMEQNSQYDFDLSKGIITFISYENRQNYGSVGSGTGSLKLTRDTQLAVGETSRLNQDVNIYFTVLEARQKAYQDVLAGMDTAPLLDDLRRQIEQAKAAVVTPKIRAQLDEIETVLEPTQKYASRQQEILNQINHPAFAFSAIDLNGKPTALADFQGKVLVLDFWYRGCGPCMRTIPQVKALAAAYAGKPVAILGVNTDADLKDAQFVADALHLNYNVIHIPMSMANESFAVDGYPTIIVIDQNGIVRSFDEGYSPTMKVDLSRKIDALLSGPASTEPAK